MLCCFRSDLNLKLSASNGNQRLKIITTPLEHPRLGCMFCHKITFVNCVRYFVFAICSLTKSKVTSKQTQQLRVAEPFNL